MFVLAGALHSGQFVLNTNTSFLIVSRSLLGFSSSSSSSVFKKKQKKLKKLQLAVLQTQLK